MVPLLVLITVAIFIAVQLLFASRKREKVVAGQLHVLASLSNEVIQRYLHPSHSWVLVENPQLVAVGVDDFTQRFLGKMESLELPSPGTVIHQGKPLAILTRGNRQVTTLAPLTGVVHDVNPKLKQEPGIINNSPLEYGWIAKIVPSNLRVELRNLLKGIAAERWEDATRMQLIQLFGATAGPVLQDGGQLIENFTDRLSDEEWARIGKEFFPLCTVSKQIHLLSKK